MNFTVAMALVADPSDPEGRGRIKVSYPWLPQCRELPWAPVASPLSGRERGMFFMPEKGDEVLVAFEQGDFDHPIVVGFMWNGNQRAPEPDYQNRVILTPGGHTLRFEDGDDKRIILRTAAGHEVRLDDTATGKGITVTSLGGHEVALRDGGASQGVFIKTNGQLGIALNDSQQSIELSGGGRTLSMQGGVLSIR
jgi:uncharacterized protein involved in type VI secretion and phage assembly